MIEQTISICYIIIIMSLEEIAKKFKKARKEVDLTQLEVAEKSRYEY